MDPGQPWQLLFTLERLATPALLLRDGGPSGDPVTMIRINLPHPALGSPLEGDALATWVQTQLSRLAFTSGKTWL